MSDLNQAINDELAKENERLQQHAEALERALSITGEERNRTLGQILAYMPQVTNLASNTAYVASAIQSVERELISFNNTMNRIALTLESIEQKARDHG